MNKVQKTLAALTISAVFIPSVSSYAENEFSNHDNPDFANKIDKALLTACPDPTPSFNSPTLRACADATWKQAYNIAANVSTFIKNNSGQDFWSGAAQGELLTCEWRAKAMNKKSFDPKNPIPYVQSAVDTATECILSIDRAESAVRKFIDTPAQNYVIDQINCFRNPTECKRPELRR